MKPQPLHKSFYSDGFSEWHHLYAPEVGFGNVGARRSQHLAAVWERSYLSVGADGSQLCVWPELCFRVRHGRDGEMEGGGREESRRHNLAPINFQGGVGMKEGKRKRRASRVPVKSVPGWSRPAWGERGSQPPSLCVQECNANLCQGVDFCFAPDFLCSVGLFLFPLHLICSVSPSLFILILSHPAWFSINTLFGLATPPFFSLCTLS